VRAARFLLDSELSGPVNLTAPAPVTNAEFTAALARALHRPARLGVPAAVLRAVMGEAAGEVLGSARVLPARLTGAGFGFRYPEIGAAAQGRAELAPPDAGGPPGLPGGPPASAVTTCGEREAREAEVGERLAEAGRAVAGELRGVGVDGVDERGDDVAAAGEVDLLHLPLDFPAQRGADGGVGLV